jgi:hypothetical protein
MKNFKIILLGGIFLSTLQFGLVGCVAEVDGPGYYHGDPWYHDGPWMDGPRWRGGPETRVDIDIHPPERREWRR